MMRPLCFRWCHPSRMSAFFCMKQVLPLHPQVPWDAAYSLFQYTAGTCKNQAALFPKHWNPRGHAAAGTGGRALISSLGSVRLPCHSALPGKASHPCLDAASGAYRHNASQCRPRQILPFIIIALYEGKINKGNGMSADYLPDRGASDGARKRLL